MKTLVYGIKPVQQADNKIKLQSDMRIEDVIDSQLAIIQNNDKHFLKILEHLLPDFPHWC